MAIIDYTIETAEYINLKALILKFMRYFPTNDFLLDTMIVYLYEEILSDDKNIDILNNDLPRYLKSKYQISLGKHKRVIDWNPLFDRHMRILGSLGIGGNKIYKKILNSEYVQDGMESFSSPLHKFTVENTFLKSIIIQYAVLELIKVAIQEEIPEMPYMVINDFNIDFSELDMYRRCRCLPKVSTIHNLQVGKMIEEFTDKQWDSEFIEIASFELEKYCKGERNCVLINREKGIVFKDTDVILNHVWIASSMFDVECYLDECQDACCVIYESNDFSFDTKQYLWLREDIACELGIYKKNDYEKNRIIGVAEDGTTVLVMHNWRCSYAGDNKSGAMEVPLYDGIILYMRRDYLEKMQNKYGKLYYATVIKRA